MEYARELVRVVVELCLDDVRQPRVFRDLGCAIVGARPHQVEHQREVIGEVIAGCEPPAKISANVDGDAVFAGEVLR